MTMMISPSADAPVDELIPVDRFVYFAVTGLRAPLYLAVSIDGDEKTGYDVVFRFLQKAQYDARPTPASWSKLAASKALHYDVVNLSDVYSSLVETLGEADESLAKHLEEAVERAGINPYLEEDKEKYSAHLDAVADFVRDNR